MNAPGVGSDELGEAARRRAHDAVAGLDALHLGADGLDFAGTFQAKARADAADAAVLVARRDDEIGAVEARGPHPDQNLVRLRFGLRQVPDLDTFLADNGSFHGTSSLSLFLLLFLSLSLAVLSLIVAEFNRQQRDCHAIASTAIASTRHNRRRQLAAAGMAGGDRAQ